jgi:hypothetical protein
MLIGLPACARWPLVNGRVQMESQGFEVTVPAGWHRAALVKNLLILTRDGLALQFIRIGRVPLDDHPRRSKKRFAKGMLPQDLAEVELDAIRSDADIANFELIQNVPITVAGHSGFKLVYSFKVAGLRVKRVHYGFLLRDWVYRIQFQAAARYYFDRDLPAFERVFESFKVADKV